MSILIPTVIAASSLTLTLLLSFFSIPLVVSRGITGN